MLYSNVAEQITFVPWSEVFTHPYAGWRLGVVASSFCFFTVVVRVGQCDLAQECVDQDMCCLDCHLVVACAGSYGSLSGKRQFFTRILSDGRGYESSDYRSRDCLGSVQLDVGLFSV